MLIDGEYLVDLLVNDLNNKESEVACYVKNLLIGIYGVNEFYCRQKDATDDMIKLNIVPDNANFDFIRSKNLPTVTIFIVSDSKGKK